MGWTLMEPQRPPSKPKASEGATLSLRVMAGGGAAARLGLGRDLLKRLGWEVGAALSVSIGQGADRGWLRVIAAEDGVYRLAVMAGRGKGAGVVSLGRHRCWAEERGKWKISPSEMKVEGVAPDALVLRLPAESLSREAKAVA